MGAAVTVLHLGVLGAIGQTNKYLYTGSEVSIPLYAGKYNITACGAEGSHGGDGTKGGLGAEMEGQFMFGTATNLTILVGGIGLTGSGSGGSGGGTFVFGGRTPLVIAGGGGGGRSYIGSSAVMVVKEASGVASPDDSPNGEIIITAVQVPPPSPLPLFLSHSGNTVTIYWQNQFGWSLQQSINPAPSGWTTRTAGITTFNGTNYLNVVSPKGTFFFRLSY